ncbi:spore germination protein [Peribacillus acanthi]|uniref:spore germination protein n=1 Tax=Peribacillus acanthi TaxID=2171554 RepID=UPI000D3E3262|nr:spore germination protein [Peribacillus acanthi]
MWFQKNKAKNNEQDLQIERDTSEPSVPVNEQSLAELFKKCSDVKFVTLNYNEHKVVLFYCIGLVSTEILYRKIPETLEAFFETLDGEPTKENILNGIHIPSIDEVTDSKQVIKDIFAGKLFIDFGIEGTVFSLDICDRPQRNPEETKTEMSLMGPRDNFIEDIIVNMALIRKRLRTTTLVSEAFEIGERTQTKVALLYMEDIANDEFLKQIRDKLNSIKIDGLFSGTQLEELLNDQWFTMFPRYYYTGRPDFATQSLLNGRVIILVDGISIAYITPVNMFYLLKSSEDKEYAFAYNSFERIIRIVGMLVATFLPGIWIALTAFHQNQLPLTFLATVVESRRGVPLSTTAEVILMLLLFELFKEAGLRLPLAVGQTLSVIGGLIIGDAAIRAGLTSPATLVVIAASSVATFTLINQSLVGTVSLIRFFVILFVSVFGFFGLFISLFFILVYIAKIRTFGVPYMALATRIDMAHILNSILRIPEQKRLKRPSMLNPKDATRREGGNE